MALDPASRFGPSRTSQGGLFRWGEADRNPHRSELAGKTARRQRPIMSVMLLFGVKNRLDLGVSVTACFGATPLFPPLLAEVVLPAVERPVRYWSTLNKAEKRNLSRGH